MDKQISIGFSRRLVFAFASLFAVLAVSGVWRAISSHEAMRALLVLVTFGGLFAAYAALLLHRRPVLLLDDDGLTDLRGGIVVRWDDIEAAHVAERHRFFDHYHDLVLTVAREQALSLSLDELTRSWRDVVKLIEGRMGRQVSIRRETGVISRRPRRRSCRTEPSGVSRIPTTPSAPGTTAG
jgi:hypothetical protein